MLTMTADFFRRLPKTDLHLHLDGSLRLSTLIELAQQNGVTLPSYSVEGLRETVFKSSYSNLSEYLQGFGYTCAVLQNAEALERVAYELAEDNISEGVRYIEVRFAPQLHMHDDLDASDVVSAVVRGLQRATDEYNRKEAVTRGDDIPFVFGIITCAMRRFTSAMGTTFSRLISSLSDTPRDEIYALASYELARTAVRLRDEGMPVVGFDLAGEESGYPAENHRRSYQYAHRHFLRKTVHAGEAYGPESIFQAITECHANRIGHGTFLFDASAVRDREISDPERYVEQLSDSIAALRITMEVCLTSNLQTTPSIISASEHPLREMIKRNLSVTLCTDNRLVSNTSITKEFMLATEALDITPHQLRNLVIAGFKGSFFPGNYTQKREYVRRAITRYEAVIASTLSCEASA